MRVLFSSLVVFSILFSGVAAARDYQVELLVFERVNPGSNAEEIWNPESNVVETRRRELAEMGQLASSTNTRPGVNRLKRVEENLKNAGYRVLAASRWVQPARVYQNAPVISIGSAGSSVTGFLRVYKTSLIFADLLLALRDPAEGPIYFIKDKRRLKFKEVHYFDHPKFGAILSVWPS